MLTQTEHINTRKNHGVHVYHDTSVKARYTTKDGRKRIRRHDCWRADITIIDQRGYNRIRRRFKTQEEAMAFIHQFNNPPMKNKPNCPDETQTVTKPKEPYHFMTREELLEKEERIRQASIKAYKEQCRESREKLKDPKSKKNNEWKRINSGIIELDRQYWD